MVFDLNKATELGEQAEFLKYDFLNTADWRRQKAIEYPDDNRNLEAAELHEQLASTVDQIEPALLEAYIKAREEGDFYAGETFSEMTRTVGFEWAPKTATEFLSEFIERITDERNAA
jgi:hypothetical protein